MWRVVVNVPRRYRSRKVMEEKRLLFVEEENLDLLEPDDVAVMRSSLPLPFLAYEALTTILLTAPLYI